jgi:hypothetical protein
MVVCQGLAVRLLLPEALFLSALGAALMRLSLTYTVVTLCYKVILFERILFAK